MSEVLYVVIGPGRWNYPKILRVLRKCPTIKDGLVAFKLEIELPRDILTAPTIPVKVEEKNIIRQIPKAI